MVGIAVVQVVVVTACVTCLSLGMVGGSVPVWAGVAVIAAMHLISLAPWVRSVAVPKRKARS